MADLLYTVDERDSQRRCSSRSVGLGSTKTMQQSIRMSPQIDWI